MDFDHTTGLIQNINSTDGVVTVGGTGGFQVPTGTTAQRPATPGFGTLRINSTLSALEYYNNSTWATIGGGVSSVALTLPSIFSVTGSPITSAGTLSATLTNQAANTVLAGPTSGSATPSFRTLSLATGALSDVSTTGAASTNLLAYNGTTWVPSPVASGSASGILSTWTSIGGTPTRYTASFSHNLATFAVVVSLFDSTTNQLVLPDSLQLTSANAVLVTVASNTRSLRIVVVANGQAIAAGSATNSSVLVQNGGSPVGTSFTTLNFTGGTTAVDSGSGVATISSPTPVVNAGGAPSIQEAALASRPTAGTAGRLFLATDTNILYRDTGSAWVPLTAGVIRTMSFVAPSFDTPNSSDWVVNALAPATPDPSYTSLLVRSFDQTTEQGVGFLITPPATATSCTFTFKGRPQIAQATAQVVQPRIYRRTFAAGSAAGAWSVATELSNIAIPATANFVYASQTVTLATLGWTAGQLTLVELTRRTSGVTGGTNLATAFLLAELQLEFT
jgi:hypothetical protein